MQSRRESGELRVGSDAQADLDKLKQLFDRLPAIDWTNRKPALDQGVRDLLAQISLKVELFRFSDNVVLRPEATASVCRAYIEHNMQQLPQPVKLHYMGAMFRRERPQKGRYRQFYQIGAEVLGGNDAPAIDAEVIEMVMTFFDRLHMGGVALPPNSIGHKPP